MDTINVNLIGLGTRLGSVCITADELATRFPEQLLSGAEVTDKIGVTKLYKLSDAENLVDLTADTVLKLLNALSLESVMIGGVFGSSNPTSDTLLPTFTAMTTVKLGLTHVIADHVGLGCVGGVQALKSAYNQLVVDSLHNKIAYYLVVVADQTSRILDPLDYKTNLLFSEGTIATVITNDPSRNDNGYRVKAIGTKTLGSNIEVLNLYNPYGRKDNQIPKFAMLGNGVFRFGVKALLDILRLVNLDYLPGNVYLVPHQANLRMLNKMIELEEIDPNMVYTNGIKTIGNTSGPAVFFGLADALANKYFDENCQVLLGAFGAELQVGGVLLQPMDLDSFLITNQGARHE